MGFVANFIRFAAIQKFENRLRFDKVTGERFLRLSVAVHNYVVAYVRIASFSFQFNRGLYGKCYYIQNGLKKVRCCIAACKFVSYGPI